MVEAVVAAQRRHRQQPDTFPTLREHRRISALADDVQAKAASE